MTAVEVETKDLLSVFDKPRTVEDRLPEPQGADPIELTDSLPGEAYELSRRADQPGTGGPVYLWPMADGACFSTAGVSSCAETRDIEKLGVILALYRGEAVTEGATRVAGIARDGIDAVTVVLGNGDQLKVPVNENAIGIDVLDSAPIEVRWTNPDGTPASQAVPSLVKPPPSRRADAD